MNLADVRRDAEISALVRAANSVLEKMGYTEHGPRHVGYVSRVAADILRKLNYPERAVELAGIAGWVHDVGNAINRLNHGPTGASLLYPILLQKGMPIDEIMTLISAVGNHEEGNGRVVSEISAALILADKSDAHRTRVRRGQFDAKDIHDRVNYSIKQNFLIVDRENMLIRHELAMDTSLSSVMEFLGIYMSRMRMSQSAAQYLNCSFQLMVNGMILNRQGEIR